MAKVRTQLKCFVDQTIREANDVFEYNGPKVTYFDYLEGEPAETVDPVEGTNRRKPGRPRKGDATSDVMA